MKSEMCTLELAKLYESQGYYKDAYEMYRVLDREHSSGQTRAGIRRMETKLAAAPEDKPEEKTARLLEQWIKMIVLKHRFTLFKQIKSRLR